MFTALFRPRAGKALAVAALALCVSACGGKQRLPVFPVRGKVFFQGKPAAGAVVVLNRVGQTDPTAVLPQGTVGTDGTFQVSTYGKNDGAPAGDYAVSFVWLLTNSKTESEWTPLPRRYMVPGQSGVRVTVNEKVNELQPLQLRR